MAATLPDVLAAAAALEGAKRNMNLHPAKLRAAFRLVGSRSWRWAADGWTGKLVGGWASGQHVGGISRALGGGCDPPLLLDLRWLTQSLAVKPKAAEAACFERWERPPPAWLCAWLCVCVIAYVSVTRHEVRGDAVGGRWRWVRLRTSVRRGLMLAIAAVAPVLLQDLASTVAQALSQHCAKRTLIVVYRTMLWFERLARVPGG
mgnify:CR=1 FL=1